MRINVTRSSMPDFDEYCAEIRSMWDSHWLTNMGEKHQALQQKLEAYLEVPHVVLYTNGHLALENAIAAMKLPAGGEVITTPFTFASTTHAIVRNGLTPVFGDIDPETGCLDPKKAEALITEKTVALVPVHVYGNLCDTEAFAELAKRYGLKLIYDAAHAFGVRYKGVSAASFGDMSMFSFHATKVFNTIEGGALCFADDSLVQEMNDRKNFGIRDEETCEYAGGNAKMNEFQAAMGLCNLRHLSQELEKRKAVQEAYRRRLSGVPGIRLLPLQKDVTPNYAYFPVLFEGYRHSRDEVYSLLRAQDIVPRKYFYPLTSDYGVYRERYGGGEKTPLAAQMARNVLTLPMYADLPLSEVDRIADIILNTP